MSNMYFAKLTDGSALQVTEKDYGILLKVVARSVDRGIILENGDVLKSSAVIHIYKTDTPQLHIYKTDTPQLQVSSGPTSKVKV